VKGEDECKDEVDEATESALDWLARGRWTGVRTKGDESGESIAVQLSVWRGGVKEEERFGQTEVAAAARYAPSSIEGELEIRSSSMSSSKSSSSGESPFS